MEAEEELVIHVYVHTVQKYHEIMVPVALLDLITAYYILTPDDMIRIEQAWNEKRESIHRLQSKNGTNYYLFRLMYQAVSKENWEKKAILGMSWNIRIKCRVVID